MVIAVLDAGFDNLPHAAFATTRIVATRDFVNGDDDVANGGIGEGSHGTATLSVLGGFQPGQIIGPAYAASFILAKTENTESETPVEEDNWAAADRVGGVPRRGRDQQLPRIPHLRPAVPQLLPPPTWTATPRSAPGPRTSPASVA